MLHTKDVEKVTTHILYSISFFLKPVPFRDNVENMAGPDRPQMSI